MEHLTGNIELIPHFELEPNDFLKKKTKTFYNTPRRHRVKMWKENFAKAGIEGLTLVDPQHPQTPLRGIQHPLIMKHIYTLIQREADNDGTPIDPAEELLGHADGGLTLSHDGTVIVASMCCSDLNNLNDWREAAKYRGSEWQMLWNGHPWVHVRYSHEALEVTDHTENTATANATPRYAFSPGALQTAIENAEKEIADFQQRFRAFIETQNTGK